MVSKTPAIFDRGRAIKSRLARASGWSIIPGRVGSPSGDQTGIRWGLPVRAKGQCRNCPRNC